MKIYRYELELIGDPSVPMPKGAQVLSVSTERDRLECWALVDPMVAEIELREFRVVGTGNPAPEDLGRFIGTVLVYGGHLVFHVFEAAS
jgi:hypothetical protein